MKKRVVCLLVLCLFILSNTAFATNWIYYDKSSDGISIYFDTDSSKKNSDTITFWTLGIWDQTRQDGIKKIMAQNEATLSTPRYSRQIDSYTYDEQNNQLSHNAQSTQWEPVRETSRMARLIDMAFRYAK